MRSEPIPIACTLDSGRVTDQLAEWAELQRHATARLAIPGGARLTFAGSLRATVEDLARREQACCAFLDIGVSNAGAEVVLEVTAEDPDALPVIHALTGAGGTDR